MLLSIIALTISFRRCPRHSDTHACLLVGMAGEMIVHKTVLTGVVQLIQSDLVALHVQS